MATLFAPIVVADDDAVGRELVSRVLEKAGHPTVTAPDGERAWELIQSVKPPLAVLDWDMPHLSGLDVLRRVKLTVDRTPPYVLLLTSSLPSSWRGSRSGCGWCSCSGRCRPG